MIGINGNGSPFVRFICGLCFESHLVFGKEVGVINLILVYLSVLLHFGRGQLSLVARL